jgi:hypothetical protein
LIKVEIKEKVKPVAICFHRATKIV